MKTKLFLIASLALALNASAQIPNYVPTNGLVAWYPFTGNANDSSGNGYNASVSGATLTTDRFGHANSAYSFDGASSNNISIGDNAAFDTPQGTWSIWVKTTSVSGGNGYGIMEKGSNTTSNMGIQEYQGLVDGKLAWTPGFAAQTSYGTSPMNDGIWHLYVITWDGSNFAGYFDGVQVGSSVSYPGINLSNGYAIEIGRVDEAYFQSYNGNADDVGIWNRVLSPCEISQLYHSQPIVVNPTITHTGNTTFCNGDSITLDGGLYSSYLWYNSANSTTETITVSTTGTYSLTVTDSNQCTGFASINVTVNPTYTSNVSASICQGNTYTFPDNTTSTTSTIHTSHLSTFNSCDSSIVTTLTIDTVNTSTTTTGITITANATGATYQWLNCNTNYSIISGATNQSYSATADGNYAVIVNNGTCSDTSACVNITTLGINQYSLNNNQLTIYPNPATTAFTVTTTGSIIKEIKVFDVVGSLVFQSEPNNNQSTINSSHFSKGIYFVQITDENRSIINKKIIIQ